MEVCYLCAEDCRTCDVEDLNKCLSCHKDKFLTKENRCKYECEKGTFYNKESERCEDCINHCIDCNNTTSCEKCLPEFYLQPNKQSCDPECPINHRRTNDNKCENCTDEHCNKCDRHKCDCTKCEENRVLFDKKCLERCPSGYYSDNNKNCIKCNLKCTECTSDKTCTVCPNPNDHLTPDGECVDKCPDGSVSVVEIQKHPPEIPEMEVKVCHKCIDTKCKKCESTNLNSCIECDKDSFLIERSHDHRECVNKCPDGYFVLNNDLGESTGVCKKCSDNCSKCEDENKCISCETGLIENGKCVNSCSEGHYQKDDKCLPCNDTNCGLCNKNDPSQCNKCKGDFFLKNGKCVNSCGDNYYEDNSPVTGRNCNPCIDNCNHCVNGKTCNECKYPLKYSPVSQTCMECNIDNGWAFIGLECHKCEKDNCKTCPSDKTRLSECTECKENFFLSTDGNCTPNCGSGFYENRELKKCVECLDKTCEKCIPQNNCLKCKDNLVLLNGKCEVSCNLGYYETDDKECKPCIDPNCTLCNSQDPEKCYSCKDPFFLQFKDVIKFLFKDKFFLYF